MAGAHRWGVSPSVRLFSGKIHLFGFHMLVCFLIVSEKNV